jgi:hypothetical protein
VTRVERDGVDQTQGFDLQAGTNLSNFRIFVTYGSGVIRGTVKFENGTPPSNTNMYVGIRKAGGGSAFERGVSTDVRGRFLISDVPSGNYEITLSQGYTTPARQLPQLKQFVTVADDTEVEVVFTVDLKPKDGGP